jgi:hypothetical protein
MAKEEDRECFEVIYDKIISELYTERDTMCFDNRVDAERFAAKVDGEIRCLK